LVHKLKWHKDAHIDKHKHMRKIWGFQSPNCNILQSTVQYILLGHFLTSV